MTADDIIKLLAEKHKDDVFIDQCKTGPSQSGLSIFDAWAMVKSWAHPCAYGYEVKISRNDFLRDNKWAAYLNYCNQMYFVCPTDLIKPEELPSEVGLLWVSKNGTRLFCKRKAAHRDIVIPNEIYQYILMARAKIQREGYNDNSTKQYWQRWLLSRNESRDLGYSVSKAIREKYESDVVTVQKQNQILAEKIERLESVQKVCDELGINTNSEYGVGYNAARFRKAVEEARRVIPAGLVESLSECLNRLSKFSGEAISN